MECDEDQDGIVTLEALLKELNERKMVYPMPIFNFMLNTLRV